MRKYYYENVLANENITAKTNIAWVTDITEVNLDKQRKVYVFLCIDVNTNILIAQTISRKTIKAHAIVNCLTKAIEKRFRTEPIRKVILHTDRVTQFSNKAYNDFTRHFEMFIIPSMSRENTPTDNATAERFMRTFKEHKISVSRIPDKIKFITKLRII